MAWKRPTPRTAPGNTGSLIFATELKVLVGEQAAPKHNAVARGWLEFLDGQCWLRAVFRYSKFAGRLASRLSKLIMGAEADLILAQAYKALEPSQEPPFKDDLAINDLYYIHDRKMNLLNQSVQDLIRVQDLVNRLLHESLGGDLVDTTKPNWEKSRLTRENIEKQLETRRASGAISQANFDAITQALAIPNNKPGADIAIAYRNRLMHHMRPSSGQYSMFFSSLESRAGEEVRTTWQSHRKTGPPTTRPGPLTCPLFSTIHNWSFSLVWMVVVEGSRAMARLPSRASLNSWGVR